MAIFFFFVTLEIKIKQCIAAQKMALATSKLHEESMGTEQDLENIEEVLREADAQSELLKQGLEAAQSSVDQEAVEELLGAATDEAMFDAAEEARSIEKDAELQARLDQLRHAGGGLKKKKKKTKTKKRKRMRA